MYVSQLNTQFIWRWQVSQNISTYLRTKLCGVTAQKFIILNVLIAWLWLGSLSPIFEFKSVTLVKSDFVDILWDYDSLLSLIMTFVLEHSLCAVDLVLTALSHLKALVVLIFHMCGINILGFHRSICSEVWMHASTNSGTTDLSLLSDTVRVIISRRLRWAGHVVRMKFYIYGGLY